MGGCGMICLPNHYDFIVMVVAGVFYGNILVGRGWNQLVAYLFIGLFTDPALATLKFFSMILVDTTKSWPARLVMAIVSALVGCFIFALASLAVGPVIMSSISLSEIILALAPLVRGYLFEREARG